MAGDDAVDSPGGSSDAARNALLLRRANEKLHREIAARQRLEQEILKLSEREQQRIGRHLHDELGQQLAAISFLSHTLATALAASGSPAADQARKICEAIGDALSLTRSLARGLHPVALKSDGLLAALTDLAGQTAETYAIECRFKGPAIDPPLDDIAATHLYRIASEAVSNAVNHGKASVIDLSLECGPAASVLRVCDNGHGMPRSSPRRKGMGLRIMRYRADVIGGTLVFSTPRHGGTTVTCSVQHEA